MTPIPDFNVFSWSRTYVILSSPNNNNSTKKYVLILFFFFWYVRECKSFASAYQNFIFILWNWEFTLCALGWKEDLLDICLRAKNSGIVGEAAWPIGSQAGCILDSGVSWEGSLGWITFKTTNMICFVLCWKTNLERIDVCAAWMVITTISSSEKFFTWACKLIYFYRPHHPGMIWFAAEILLLKKIIAEVCDFFF